MNMRYAIGLATLLLACSGSEVSTVSSDDPCRGTADPDATCIEIYQPVCGCDGQTYGNECYAEAAGILQMSEGECPDVANNSGDRAIEIAGCKTEPQPKPCTRDYRLVCGCDGVTYANACVAEANGVLESTPGACEDPVITDPADPSCKGPGDPAMICPAIYAPVCGCDGETYGNECQAQAEGVRQWTEGECGADSVSQANRGPCMGQPKPDQVCTMEYNPVCGCNQVTYGNACMAEGAGVLRWVSGECEVIGQDTPQG